MADSTGGRAESLPTPPLRMADDPLELSSFVVPRIAAEPLSCFYCGCDLEPLAARVTPRSAVQDHVIPRVYGGASDETNLVWCCWNCNSSKHKRLFPLEWVPDVGRNTILRINEPVGVGAKPWHLGLTAVGIIVWLQEAWTEPIGLNEVAAKMGACPSATRTAATELLYEGWFAFAATTTRPYQRWLTLQIPLTRDAEAERQPR